MGWKDPLEEGMATHSNILAYEIPWAEDPGGLQSMGSRRFRMAEHTHICTKDIVTVISSK